MTYNLQESGETPNSRQSPCTELVPGPFYSSPHSIPCDYPAMPETFLGVHNNSLHGLESSCMGQELVEWLPRHSAWVPILYPPETFGSD